MGVEAGADVDHLVAPRLAKLDRLRHLGIEPYPHNFDRSHTSARAISEFEANPDDETKFD